MTGRFDNLQGAVDDLEARIKAKREELSALNKELRDLRMSACPVAEGDIVICTRRGKRVEAIVRAVELRSWDKLGDRPWIKVSLKRADGEWSKAVIHAFNGYEVRDAQT